MSQERFAEHLGIATRTVASWHQKSTLRPKTEIQQLLDTALERAAPNVRARFAELTTGRPASTPSADAEQRLSSDLNIGTALDWLDRHAGWETGGARRAVASRLDDIDVHALHDRSNRRSRVSQREVSDVLAGYYGIPTAPYGFYRAVDASNRLVHTSVLTRPDWLDLDCPLRAPHDRLSIDSAIPDGAGQLDAHATNAAVQRLAEALTMGIRLVDWPLYRMTAIDVRKHQIGGSVGITSFPEYALTMDLLEGELIDVLAARDPHSGSALPLRDMYLPDLASVLDVSSRLCAGGPLALCAIARPANAFREADYLLLIQERSGHVLNAARRLAVIPKAFHQPLIDVRADAQVGATLRREMEEELFGRSDVDSTIGARRSVDPMHPSLLSAPMHWLTQEPERLRIECTGFGLNLVSGNYEFASLIVIDDEEFWTRFGGIVQVNWESSSVHQYSTLDADLVTNLVGDVAWSNEGLFAMTQGLRRLTEIGGRRVRLSPIEWEVRQ